MGLGAGVRRRRQRMEENTQFVVEDDSFQSTRSQQAICAASLGLVALSAGEAISSASTVADSAELALR